jgi:preprotein translocase subunit YajC
MDPTTLLLLLLMVAVFWLILIRPQQKQRREIAQLQSALAPGSRVMTGSGLIGTIVALEGDEVVLEVAPGVTNRYVRRAIMRVIPDEVPEPVTSDEAPDSVTPHFQTDATTRPAADNPDGDENSGTQR